MNDYILMEGLEHLRGPFSPSAGPPRLDLPRKIEPFLDGTQLIVTEEEACKLLEILDQQNIAWLGFDTKFYYRLPDDITSLELCLVSLAPIVRKD